MKNLFCIGDLAKVSHAKELKKRSKVINMIHNNNEE